MNNQKSIIDLHAEHKAWLSKLSFYHDEAVIMQNRVNEIAAKNTSKDVLAMVDHFQNQLTIQNGQISNLRHEIKKHEDAIEASIKNNPTAADHRKGENHSEQHENMERFEVIFAELKKELTAFLAKNL